MLHSNHPYIKSLKAKLVHVATNGLGGLTIEPWVYMCFRVLLGTISKIPKSARFCILLLGALQPSKGQYAKTQTKNGGQFKAFYYK